MIRYPFLLLIVFLAACSTPAMLVDPGLSEQAAAYSVEGRQGWLVNQELRFGPYRSTEIKRGWTFSYDVPFVVRFQGTREKLSFGLTAGGAGRAEVLCLGKVTQQDLTWFSEWFDINLNTSDLFSGTIVLGAGADAWEFVLANANSLRPDRPSAGMLRHGSTVIDIEEVRQLENGKSYIGETYLGYHFRQDGRVIAAVETINNGRVWISEALPEDQRLALAAAAAAILLRSDLSEQVS